MHTKKSARKREKQLHVRKITKLSGGASFGIILPKTIVKQLGWHEKQKVAIALKRRRIIIQDWKK